MIRIPTADPGMVVVWWPADGAEPNARTFTGERGPSEAKKFVMALLEKGNGELVRVFSMLEMFQVAGTTVKRIPDQWAPVLDLMLREQALGQGMTTAKRGPPPKPTAEYIAEVARVDRDEDR